MENLQESTDIQKCRKLIYSDFNKNDLIQCLKKISYSTEGEKYELQNRLWFVLNSQEECEKGKQAILERGIIFGYCSRSEVISFGNLPLSLALPKTSYLEVDGNCDFGGSLKHNQLKKFFFYKNVMNLTKWRTIGPIVHTRPVIIRFSLPKVYRTNCYDSRQGSIMFLRSCKVIQLNTGKEAIECYPISMRLCVNRIDVTEILPREIFYNTSDIPGRLAVPTILDKALQRHPRIFSESDYVEISIRFDPERNKNETFSFAVFHSSTKTVKEICDEVCKREKVTIKEFEEFFNKFISASSDVITESIKISLRSAITYRTIRIPFRGRNCEHITPDDLEDYLELNKDNEKWLCKICGRTCTPDDIMIDQFYVDILKKYPTVDEINFFSGLGYEVISCNRILAKNNCPSTKSNDDNTIVIDSDDENNQVAWRRMDSDGFSDDWSFRSSASGTEDIECIVIDDDTEIEPPKKRKRVVTREGPTSSNNHSSMNSESKCFHVQDISQGSNTVTNNNYLNTTINPGISIIRSISEKSDFSFLTDKSLPSTSIGVLKEHILNGCHVFNELLREGIGRNATEVKPSQIINFKKPKYLSDNLWNVLNAIPLASLFYNESFATNPRSDSNI